MPELDGLIRALDSAHWELSVALEELPDEDVWKRPDPRLLSVGELAAHIAYGEASSFFGDFPISITANPVAYYPSAVGNPAVGQMGAEAILKEIQRVHLACKEAFLADPKPAGEINSLRGDWTWEYTLQYAAFHVAYHTGQIYSVRHLLGHETVDN
jgi:uncharacterized damage-inducible protein DinB